MMWRMPGKRGRALAATGILAASGALATLVKDGAAVTGERLAEGRAGVGLDALARFDQPTFLAAPDGARDLVFVTEREGKIKLLEGERKRGTFLDMRRWVGCCRVETGLLSIAFPADYGRTGRFYVYFTNRQENLEIDQFRRSRAHRRRASPGSRRKLIEIRQRGSVNHNGGTVAIGPDGLLYAATGDGGRFDDPSRAPQRKGSLLGKLLRINPRRGEDRPYRIPRTNPYVGKPGRNEIYARGLRNPFRISIDRDRMFIGDVGQDRREEVNMMRLRKRSRANFGWPVYEGTLRFLRGRVPHHERPMHQYPHAGPACAITGGVVIRDPRLGRGLRGRYIYGDYCSGQIRTFKPRKGHSRKDRPLGVRRANGPVAFGTDGRRRVYLVELASGRVSRIDPR
jgi:glucose/arabinose dehydrogenase